VASNAWVQTSCVKWNKALRMTTCSSLYDQDGCRGWQTFYLCWYGVPEDCGTMQQHQNPNNCRVVASNAWVQTSCVNWNKALRMTTCSSLDNQDGCRGWQTFYLCWYGSAEDCGTMQQHQNPNNCWVVTCIMHELKLVLQSAGRLWEWLHVILRLNESTRVRSEQARSWQVN
jgi:hypothetical protein